MKLVKVLLMGLALSAFAATAFAEDKAYKEGPVISMSFIKIKPGKFDDYMKFLDTSYKAIMEANKQAGLILDYGVYSTEARNPHEPDLILTTTYANMAALDRSDESDALAVKILGSMATMNQGAIDRGAMREVLGSQLMRKLILK